MPFQNDLQNRCSEFKLCLQNINITKQCHAQNDEDAFDGAYSVNFLNDSELLDLGSAFNLCQSLGTCA